MEEGNSFLKWLIICILIWFVASIFSEQDSGYEKSYNYPTESSYDDYYDSSSTNDSSSTDYYDSPSEQKCHPSYSGCLNPNASDYDCIGGSGNGPYYTGTVRVLGPDVFGLDRDGDGWGCE